MWALFMLIQAWKIYDLYVLQSKTYMEETSLNGVMEESSWFPLFSFLHPKVSFVFKYFFFDSLLILVIPFLNIPKLSFTPAFSIVLLLAINLITIVLTCSFSFTLSTILYSIYRTIVPEKELAIMETYVDSNSIINQAEHFKGKKTIRYAPDSSIKINPFNEQFCIRPVYNDKIKIPIKLESTYDLQYLQINHRDFSNVDNVFNYTQRELRKFVVGDYYNSPYIKYDPSVLADSNTKILEIPVDKPGHYSIKMATDKKDKVIRSFRSDTIVPVCPEAAFVRKPSYSIDKCIDDLADDLEITLLGVPPFTLFYEEEINGKLSKLPPTIVSHVEKVESPLNLKETKKNSNVKYAAKYLRDITWAKSFNISVSLGEKKFHQPGNYIYTINKVIDGFGNVVNYTPDPNDSSSFVSFISHPKPLLNLVDPKPMEPILLNREKYLEVRISNTNSFRPEVPYDVTFKYTPNENDRFHEPETFDQSFDLKENSKLQIKVDKPGTYSLEEGSSRYCRCKIGLSSVNIFAAKPPNMTVVLDPIIDNCVGTTGFKFNLDFVGTAPFEIGYKISKLDVNDASRVLRVEKLSSIKSESSTLEYDFKPSSEGSYSIEFLSLNDKYYKNEIKFKQGEYRYVTYFKQRPKAYFDKYNKVKRLRSCHNESAEIILNIEGKPPFNVTYDLISPDYAIQTYKLDNVLDHEVKLETPNLNKGGEYILSLKHVADSTNCEVDFRGQEVHIDVKNDIPQLSFQKDETFEIVKGESYAVPLRTQSSALIDLVYSYTSFDGAVSKNFTLKGYDPIKALSLSMEGIYKLLSFKQDNCQGKIVNDFTVTIQYLPLPTLMVNPQPNLVSISDSFMKKSEVCQNQHDQINMKAVGSTPFIVKYEVTYPDGKLEERVEQINNFDFTLQLLTDTKGSYSYKIKDIYDSVYTEEIIKSLRRTYKYKFNPITINQKVSALPSARFLDTNSKLQTCISILNDSSKLQPIRIRLEGMLPITLKVDIYHEYDGVLETVEINDIETSLVNLLSIYEYIGIGTHIISINQVIDANGCVSDEVYLRDETITIQVNDIPKIRHLIEESNQHAEFETSKESNYYCVGDQITYMLNGIPPFGISYEFNSVVQQVEVPGNYFKRRAPGPGQLNILSLSDSSSKDCTVDYTDLHRNDLKAVIYDLPSVEIVQGDSIEEDIHEGEQVEITFLLTGTPPFKLTYIRKELDESSKIVETEIIEDIMSHEYHIMTNLEGTYEAIEIQDKYCVARNHRI